MESLIEKEFKTWLRRNSQHLRDYAPLEIAAIATAAGFPLDIVCHGTIDHVTYLKRILTLWESPLVGQWVSLSMYDNGHTWEGI